jgi:hypothetical protein
MLDDRRRDKRIDFISSSDNYPDSNSSNERFRGAKQEVLLADESYETDSYEDLGDVEDLTSLTDDSKRAAQQQPTAKPPGTNYLKSFKDKILVD